MLILPVLPHLQIGKLGEVRSSTKLKVGLLQAPNNPGAFIKEKDVEVYEYVWYKPSAVDPGLLEQLNVLEGQLNTLQTETDGLYEIYQAELISVVTHSLVHRLGQSLLLILHLSICSMTPTCRSGPLRLVIPPSL